MPRKGVFPFVVADIKKILRFVVQRRKIDGFQIFVDSPFYIARKILARDDKRGYEIRAVNARHETRFKRAFRVHVVPVEQMPLEFFQRQRRVQRVFHPVFCRFVVGDFKNACRHVGKYRKPDIRRRGIVLIIPFRQHCEIVGHKRIFLGYEIFVHKFCVGQKIIRSLDFPFFLFPDAPRKKRLP